MPPTGTNTDVYHRVYKSRYEIGCNRQEHFTPELRAFNQFLTDLQRMHPYGKDPKLFDKCKSIRSFCNGDQAWIPAHPKQTTLYRIANLKKMFLANDDFIISVRDDAPRIKKIRTEADIPPAFDQLRYSERHNPERWLRLSDYLSIYEPVRGLSWWTPFPLGEARDPVDLLSRVHRIGLPNDWIGEYSVIMKLDLSSSETPSTSPNAPTVWVPSVIDACLSSIFKAQPQKSNPKSGIAINIKDPAKMGEEEYVVRGDILTNVQFRPIQVKKEYWHDSTVSYGNVSESLYQSIIDHH